MAGNSDSDETPEPERIIQNPANREIVTLLGNMVMEARQHTIGLRALYEMMKEWGGIVPRPWMYKLVEEEERHIARADANLSALRAVAG